MSDPFSRLATERAATYTAHDGMIGDAASPARMAAPLGPTGPETAEHSFYHQHTANENEPLMHVAPPGTTRDRGAGTEGDGGAVTPIGCIVQSLRNLVPGMGDGGTSTTLPAGARWCPIHCRSSGLYERASSYKHQPGMGARAEHMRKHVAGARCGARIYARA